MASAILKELPGGKHALALDPLLRCPSRTFAELAIEGTRADAGVPSEGGDRDVDEMLARPFPDVCRMLPAWSMLGPDVLAPGRATATLVIVPSSLVVAVYLLAATAGVKLLAGPGKVCAALTVVTTSVVLPTALEHAAIMLVALGLALISHRLWRRPEAVSRPPNKISSACRCNPGGGVTLQTAA
jgi:hypothetical protein